MSSEHAIQQAIDAATSGDKSSARKILYFVVKAEPNNARAWYMLSQVVEKPDQAVYCLEQVLRINPGNEKAKERLKQLAVIKDVTREDQSQVSHSPQHTPSDSFTSNPSGNEPKIVNGEREGLVYKMEGIGETLEVYDDKVTITPHGFWGLVSKGVKGTKTIPFISITAIQFKKPGLTSGYLQFSVPGGIEGGRGVFEAARDENTFMFSGQTELAQEIKDYIEKRVKEVHMPQAAQAGTSLAEELKTLANLKENGLLSEEEFFMAKRKLLG